MSYILKSKNRTPKIVITTSFFLVSIYFITVSVTTNNQRFNNSFAREDEEPAVEIIDNIETANDKAVQNVIDLATQNATVEISSTPTPLVAVAVKKEEQKNMKKIKIGITLDNYTNPQTILDLENAIGIKFSSVSIYKHFGIEGNKLLSQSDISHLKSQGKELMVAWEPWNPSEGMSQSRDYLSEITNGSLDGYLTQFAGEVKDYAGPVVIRFGHEMNGNWYPWSKRPEEYKNAYIKIYDLFKAQGVNNTSFMWSINSENVPYEEIDNVSVYYPGDAYVNSIGIDGYNFGNSQGWSNWKSFREIFLPVYNYIVRTHNKPVVISEIGSAEVGGNKSEWINQMFSELNSNYPRVTELVWFNLNKETDWRIESSPTSLNAFKNNLK